MVPTADARKQAMRFIVMLGVVSLFADITYEGARSITGPYLAVLGASAVAVGMVAGAGELIGYSLRLLSGYVADRSGRHWTIAILGYAINLVAVPALALAGRWETAAGLMIAERVGKGVRAPARDVLLAGTAETVGTGFGFGVHEAMDQIGALAGPLVVAGVLASMHNYRTGFAVLLVPALAALLVLAAARVRYPEPHTLAPKSSASSDGRFSRSFWLYISACGLIAAGYADFPLIAFHFKRVGIASDIWIPLTYAIAMGVDAVAALAFGRLYDHWGKLVLIGAPLLAASAAPLVFLGGFPAAIAGMVLWGAGMGVQESVLRAAVADLSPADRRGSAYGIFNGAYGLCWFAGSTLMALLYAASPRRLVILSVSLQAAAIVPLMMACTARPPAAPVAASFRR